MNSTSQDPGNLHLFRRFYLAFCTRCRSGFGIERSSLRPRLPRSYPKGGNVSTVVTITGANLGGATNVSFGSAAALLPLIPPLRSWPRFPMEQRRAKSPLECPVAPLRAPELLPFFRARLLTQARNRGRHAARLALLFAIGSGDSVEHCRPESLGQIKNTNAAMPPHDTFCAIAPETQQYM
jgi:hypothetical protein